ncbi:MAG TPA: DUF5684 domain-containing protein [Candidatus Solibacter sp.]|nr:DUF5684 domain-containing protein [Candidatus Solibacter sp.]
MKKQAGLWSWFGWLFALCIVLVPGIAALAQSNEDAARAFALAAPFILFIFVAGLAFYVYHSLALQTIATKTNAENPWLAWIPIANIILMLNIAKKPLWWIILFLIPLANIVVAVIVWMEIAKARGKPDWWGIMVVVPIMNLIMPGYLAWAD